MSLFDSFSAPKWQHKKPEIRLQAVAELQDQSTLLELVNSDPDTSVQSAALARIEQPETLDTLARDLTGKLQQQARKQRLQQLLPDPAQLKEIGDDTRLLRIAELADDEDLISKAIAELRDNALRLQLAGSHPLARVRLNAASGIDDIESLRELAQLTRGKDKGVYRLCKTRVDEHDARQQAKAEQKQTIHESIEKAKATVDVADFTEFKGRHLALQQQWKTVAASATSDEAAAFQALMKQCEQRLAESSQARAAEEQASAAANESQARQQTLLAELEDLAGTTTAPAKADELARLNSILADFQQRWQETTSASPADTEAGKSFTRLVSHWQRLAQTAQKLIEQDAKLSASIEQCARADHKDYQALQKTVTNTEKLLARLSWPDELGIQAPARLLQLDQALQNTKATLSKLQEDQEKHVQRATSLVQKLEAELGQNHTKDADRALNKARQALASLEPRKRQQLDQQIKPLAAQLHEVHDWQGFAIEPKKQELCANMLALVGSSEDVDTLAAKIQALQEQWKQVGALPHAQEQELWLKFKAASDEAWKPCKLAFAKRAQIHRENFNRRIQVVTQLRAYDQSMNWPDRAESPDENDGMSKAPAPDWRLVQKTLDTAREEFRRIEPVDPKAARQSNQAFREICDRIYAHISKEYERNIGLKEQLVERAQALANEEDLSKAIEQAKRLQQDWKSVGLTPVKVDRGLWKNFRKACDAVFQRLDQQRVEEKAALSEQIVQAEAVRDQAQALLQSAEPAPQLNNELGELKQQIYGFELPPNVRQRILRDFQAMEKQTRELIQRAKAKQAAASWTALIETMKSAASSGGAGNGLDQPPVEIKLPPGIDADAINAFRQQGAGQEHDDILREACIALEVLTETDSPPEDKSARMHYQMKRLAEGMGNVVVDTDQALLDRINAFVGLRPSAEWVQRFCAVLAKIKA